MLVLFFEVVPDLQFLGNVGLRMITLILFHLLPQVVNVAKSLIYLFQFLHLFTLFVFELLAENLV